MPDLVAFVASAVGRGAAYAAVPGAVNAEAMRRGIGRGFRPALLVQVGSLVDDAAWAVLGLFGAAVLVRYEAMALALGLVGAGMLFALARTAFAEAISGHLPAAGAGRSGGDLAVGLVFGLANPAGLTFWAGIGGGVLASGEGPVGGRALGFLAGFLVGAMVWGCVMAALVAWGRRFVGSTVFRWPNAVCGVALAWFGLRLLWSTVRRFGRWVPWAARAWA